MTGQFTVIQNKHLKDARLTKSDKVVLLVLQSHMGTNGYCWPKYDTIASESGLSRRTVIYSMKRLEFYGIVQKSRGTVKGTDKQSSNYYFINHNPE